MAIKAAQLKTTIEELMTKARDPQTVAAEKKASMAEALAYWLELMRAGEAENIDFDQDRVNQNLDRIYNSDALGAAERQGKLGEFASLTPKVLNDRIEALGQEIGCYAGAGEEKPARAGKLYAQMNATWRVASNSDAFNAAKQAMQDISNQANPTQLDNYLAADAVQKYVAKNLNKAKSAVGMTRMAVSLAFLKQTMSRESFAAYCNNLNALRGMKGTINEENKLSYNVNEPRCIEPDTVGTVGEVYHTFRERFHEYAAGSMKDKEIAPRDIAMLTALKNLEKKGGSDLVVEHEALVAELEKVQKDRRFQNALSTKSRVELIEMAWGGNFDTLDGYTRPLNAVQQERVTAEKNRIAQEKAKKEEAERQKKLEEEQKEQERLKAEQERLQKEQERLKAEQERIKAEQERLKKEQELRKTQRSLEELHEELLPQVQEMGNPLAPVFDILDDAAQAQNTELFAKLIALGEFQRSTREEAKKREEARKKEESPMEDKSQKDYTVNLKEYMDRVETLKKDPIVIKMAKQLREDPDMSKLIKAYNDNKKNMVKYSEKERRIYPVAQMAASLRKMYQAEFDKKFATIPVSEVYDYIYKNIPKIINGECTIKKLKAFVATSLAVTELKEKDKGVEEAKVNKTAMTERSKELMKDPSVGTLAQSLAGPTMQSKMRTMFAPGNKTGKDFVKMVNDMYKEAVAKNKQLKGKNKGPVAGK